MDDLKKHIEKYLKGELSPTQMHELEMKALHDPFLADALEGASTIDPVLFNQDVELINQKIKSKQSTKIMWSLRIAASVLLISTITYFAFQFGNDKSTDHLALQRNLPKEVQSIITQDSAKESAEISKQLLTQTLPAKDHKPAPMVRKKANEVQPDETSTSSTELLSSDDELIVNEREELIAEKETAIVTELDDRKVEILSESKAKSRRAQAEMSKQDMAPTTLSGAGASKKEFSNSSSAPSPLNGFDKFKIYLEENLQYPQKASENKIEGEVIVSFNVNVDGTLTDFKVEQAIGFGCDDELIRMIKAGPNWQPAIMNGVPVIQQTAVSFLFHIPK